MQLLAKLSLNYKNSNNLRSVVASINLKMESENTMEDKDCTTNRVDKVKETLVKELDGLSAEGLHEFFMFFYKMNHQHGSMITDDCFEAFLEAFDSNPFKLNEDTKFRKQLISNIVNYAYDHMSLLTAAILIKKKFTMAEIMENYYANIDIFGSSWY